MQKCLSYFWTGPNGAFRGGHKSSAALERGVMSRFPLFIFLIVVAGSAWAEFTLRYEGGAYLDSDRHLLFGPRQERRSITFKNLKSGNEVEV